MKLQWIVLFVSFILTYNFAFATVLEHIHPELHFDENYVINEKNLDNNYLRVIPEDMQENLSVEQSARFEQAKSILEEVLNSESFKIKVLAYRRSSDQTRAYQKNYLWNEVDNTLTNEEVYNILMQGNEFMIPDTEAEMNLYSKIKKCSWFSSKVSVWCRKVIGSTNPQSSKWITMNYKFYKNYKTSEMLANMVHEWIHLLGFLHGNVNLREEVPYVVGAIAGEVAREVLLAKGLED